MCYLGDGPWHEKDADSPRRAVCTPRATRLDPSLGARRLVKARSQSTPSPTGKRVESSHGCGV
jgi:hypothetical protein